MNDGHALFLGGPIGYGLRLAGIGLMTALAVGCSTIGPSPDKAPAADSPLANALNDATRQAAASGSNQVLNGPVALPMAVRLVPDSTGLAPPEAPPSSYSVTNMNLAGEVRRAIPGGGARSGVVVAPLAGAPAASAPTVATTPLSPPSGLPGAATPGAPLAGQPAAVATPATASAAPPTPRYRVQIGAFPTRRDAEENWSRLSRDPLLGPLQPVYRPMEPPDARGLAWRLQVGGYDSRPAADEFCHALLRRRIDCWVYAVPSRG